MLNAVKRATGRGLRKGPRGGGRDIEKILDHVLEADQGYLARLAWKHKSKGGKNPVEELSQTRQAILNALEVSVNGGAARARSSWWNYMATAIFYSPGCLAWA